MKGDPARGSTSKKIEARRMNPRSLVIEDNEEAEYGYRSYGETEKEGQTDKVR